MRMIQKHSRRTIVFMFISLIIVGQIQLSSAEEEHLIVRIVDAKYPPIFRFSEEDTFSYSIFTTYLSLEIENPTSHNITITYGCGPFPFPYLRWDLEDKNIELEHVFVIEWVEGTNDIPPGVRSKTYPIEILVFNYQEETLPRGEYTVWFDYTNCSSVPVPVVTYKILIKVTEFNVSYHFEYSDSTEVYTIEKTSYGLVFISTLVILPIYLKLIYRKEKKDFFNS